METGHFKKYLWVQTSVRRILTNELYIGTMVNHKTVTSKIYKTKTFIPPEEQYRHENFCEPIIDETTWKQAQFLLKERSQINPNHRYGKQYCTPHTVRENQLDELVEGEILRLRDIILAEGERYNKIIKDWSKKKAAV